eukprot:SAG31_NODE_17355_length_674_cov_0.888696_1_plen_44_part_10
MYIETINLKTCFSTTLHARDASPVTDADSSVQQMFHKLFGFGPA